MLLLTRLVRGRLSPGSPPSTVLRAREGYRAVHAYLAGYARKLNLAGWSRTQETGMPGIGTTIYAWNVMSLLLLIVLAHEKAKGSHLLLLIVLWRTRRLRVRTREDVTCTSEMYHSLGGHGNVL